MPAGGHHFWLDPKTMQKTQGFFWPFPCCIVSHIGAGPRPVSRKTSGDGVKNYCCLRRNDEFQEF